jgi:hypothetical protein
MFFSWLIKYNRWPEALPFSGLLAGFTDRARTHTAKFKSKAVQLLKQQGQLNASSRQKGCSTAASFCKRIGFIC